MQECQICRTHVHAGHQAAPFMYDTCEAGLYCTSSVPLLLSLRAPSSLRTFLCTEGLRLCIAKKEEFSSWRIASRCHAVSESVVRQYLAC